MHGRLKVKTTEEQEEAKRLERLKKQKLYQAATSKIFAKRAAGEYDVEALTVTGGVLAKNPDVYTLWNYRKEIYMELTKSWSEEKISTAFSEELSFLESCLGYNPKSYGSWEHRCFIMLHHPRADWKRELDLCNTFLSHDERNFHCWDYRRFVIRHAKVTPEEELNFTYEKIASNFSNYSSWHYRSKLLPNIHGADTSHSSGLTQCTLHDEMELVQNAFFTDPNDQSAWFYHRWLLGRVEKALELLDKNNSVQGRVILTFSVPVQVIDTCTESCVLTPLSGHKYCSVWLCETCEEVQSVKVQYKGDVHDLDISSSLQSTQLDIHTYFRHSMTAATTDILVRELDSCQQLFELEPENKWVLLTIVLLMNSLDPSKYEDDIRASLNKLTAVDCYRRNYYMDLQSRFLWERTLMCMSPAVDLDLSHKHLTSLHYQHLLYNVIRLNLSNNELTSVGGINYLQRLQYLDLSSNKIFSCKGLANMASLTFLNLENNLLDSQVEVNGTLATCKELKELLLNGNAGLSTQS